MVEKRTIGRATLYLADCRDALQEIEAETIDACVADPPYGLSFMGREWDHAVPGPEVWQLVSATLKPGAHLLSFFGSRTYHRGAVAIEDAGFDIRDQIMWIYGSGFPKSLDVSKAIDKAAGVKREIIGVSSVTGARVARSSFDDGVKGAKRTFTNDAPVANYETAPATDDARRWSGWGTALKPAHEPIVMARKPFRGTVAANVLRHGAGSLNIDASRVGQREKPKITDPKHSGQRHNAYGAPSGGGKLLPPGRWPANLIHDGLSEEWARYFYCAKASRADRGEGNGHPTVKPTNLMAYLVRLVTPPSGVVLDPFMGSGSTGVAALREGFGFVGIERDPHSFEIACRRIEDA